MADSKPHLKLHQIVRDFVRACDMLLNPTGALALTDEELTVIRGYVERLHAHFAN